MEIARTPLAESELVGALVASQILLTRINGEAEDSGVIGRDAELAGEGLKVPNVQTDLGAAALISTIKNSPAFQIDSLGEYQEAHEVRGNFTGFTLDFIKQEDGNFIPTIAYQIGLAMHTTPHFKMSVYATGPITTTRLTFLEDKQKDISTELALSLLDECGLEYWPSIRLIRDAAVIQDNLDASRLRHLAYHSEKIVNAQSSAEKIQAIEHKLADMVALSIPKELRANIVVRQALQLQDNKRVLHEPSVSLTAPISSVMFSDDIHDMDDTLEPTGRRVLCLVSDTPDNGLIYIPAYGITMLTSV